MSDDQHDPIPGIDGVSFTTASEVADFILQRMAACHRALNWHKPKGKKRADAARDLAEKEALVKSRKAQIILESEGPEYVRKAKADAEIIAQPIFQDYLNAVRTASQTESDYYTGIEHVHNTRAYLEASRSINSAFKAEESLSKGSGGVGDHRR